MTRAGAAAGSRAIRASAPPRACARGRREGKRSPFRLKAQRDTTRRKVQGGRLIERAGGGPGGSVPMKRQTLGLLLAGAALVAGCGGTGRDAGADQALARGALVRLSDFPAGWTDDGVPPRRQLDCPGTEQVRRLATASAYSHDFHERAEAEYAAAVYLFSDETGAADAWRRVRAHTPACYAQGLARVLVATNHDVTVRSVKTTGLAVAPAGDQHAAAHITIMLTAQGVKVPVHADLVFVRQARAVSLGAFVGIDGRFDRALRERLTAVQAQRLA